MDAVMLSGAAPVVSAFGDRASIPTEPELEAVLGAAIAPWRSVKAALAQDFDPLAERWTYAGKAYGWSLRLAHRDRPIVYLAPLAGRFRASLALPERVMPAALEADLPEPVRAIVAGAPMYPEGRAVRLEVASEDDAASVIVLARIRMAAR
jgi:hypothetical protein